ncbi:membrane protein [Amylibacter ulvae]|uniref:Membrane protein n=1 Tax=Paramylibacter ulvae TaxID=1651968 RepID=A0ABQ3DAB4_9RHOB|nr:MAPEG family protein [Amylibacter ulvae]GHA61067.1 membrane protein [Amylibacter ulvae]
MTPEITALTLAALLHVATLTAMVICANVQLPRYMTMGKRDTDFSDQITGKTARVYRTYNNSLENLMLFGIAAAIIAITGQSSAITATCAWVFLAARVFYIPAYVYGLTPWRSYIWLTGVIATTIMLIAALL